jgi:hypothetical protein
MFFLNLRLLNPFLVMVLISKLISWIIASLVLEMYRIGNSCEIAML